LDYILSLANVSSRGKAMLLRDLNKMEESADSSQQNDTSRSNEGRSQNERGSAKTDERSLLAEGGAAVDGLPTASHLVRRGPNEAKQESRLFMESRSSVLEDQSLHIIKDQTIEEEADSDDQQSEESSEESEP